MILIFDTFGGLCNQFYDIQCAINFCLINKINFTFRNASFRNNDLISWYDVPFSSLFDLTFLSKYPLYIPFKEIEFKLNIQNTYCFENKVCCNQFLSSENSDLLEQLNHLNKEFIILKQFWAIYLFKHIVEDINRILMPSPKILNKYFDIKKELSLNENQYNFIHYRYEHDFTNHFHLTNMKPLIEIVRENPFLKKDLPIYIATTNIEQFIQKDGDMVNYNIIYKKENGLNNFNFEEKAFIDYMIGIHSNEVIGHSNSSFSRMLNDLRLTNQYYNS